ncbi:hypothetical protein CUMW_257290 [Citrus unshiu]|uniref:Uncharacterized protein n=1 Tax=Citrus unshiu TaxID=55188 RepID=A0A2H5QSF4_CITUN|nr:hypothetical protein CUMW_257290 [Citrus unshiu]
MSLISFSSSSSTSSILFFIITITISFYSSNAAYTVVTFGEKPDGKTDSTLPFLRAWSVACSSTRAAIIYVSLGNFPIKAVVFGGPCKSRIVFRVDGTLLGPSNYWNLGSSVRLLGFQFIMGLLMQEELGFGLAAELERAALLVQEYLKILFICIVTLLLLPFIDVL